MSYGLGSRSYNASRENKLNKAAVAETTKRYLAGELKLAKSLLGCVVVCNCRSFRLPHSPEAHKQLFADYDWRTPDERRNQTIIHPGVK